MQHQLAIYGGRVADAYEEVSMIMVWDSAVSVSKALDLLSSVRIQNLVGEHSTTNILCFRGELQQCGVSDCI